MEEEFLECQINRHPEVRAKRASKDAIARAVHPSRAAAQPPQDDGAGEEIVANPYVLQELAKEPGTREHEIISYRRRHLVKPHGYPLSGVDGAGKRVLFHSDEKEKFGAGEA